MTVRDECGETDQIKIRNKEGLWADTERMCCRGQTEHCSHDVDCQTSGESADYYIYEDNAARWKFKGYTYTCQCRGPYTGGTFCASPTPGLCYPGQPIQHPPPFNSWQEVRDTFSQYCNCAGAGCSPCQSYISSTYIYYQKWKCP